MTQKDLQLSNEILAATLHELIVQVSPRLAQLNVIYNPADEGLVYETRRSVKHGTVLVAGPCFRRPDFKQCIERMAQSALQVELNETTAVTVRSRS